MKKVVTAKLRPGMIAAKAITTKRGQVIAAAGTELTSQLIARLSFYKIDAVFVSDDATFDDASIEEPTLTELETLPEPEVIEPEVPEKEEKLTITQVQSYAQKLKSTPKFQTFQTNYSKGMVNLKDSFDQILSGNVDHACDSLLKEANDIFAKKTSLEIFDMIHNMRSVDDSVYAHSINVALIAKAIGKWLHLSKEDLEVLTTAGLLHDIGKAQIPEEVLNKQGKLTDEEFQMLRSHAKAGHKILKDTNLDPRIKLAALQHHERFDGSGYPRGLDGDEIDFFASIIAIADVYDAMTATRSYRNGKCAFQVIYEFEQEGFQKYNPEVIYTFLQRVAGCYNNSRVLLSNGMGGRVVFLNKNSLSRPIIETDDNDMLDLSLPANKDIYIQSIM